jgi:hypothetical protein
MIITVNIGGIFLEKLVAAILFALIVFILSNLLEIKAIRRLIITLPEKDVQRFFLVILALFLFFEEREPYVTFLHIYCLCCIAVAFSVVLSCLNGNMISNRKRIKLL